MPQTVVTLETSGQGLYEITREAAAFVRAAGVGTGLLTLFVRHTSCSLVVQENADTDVRRDLDAFFRRLVPPADDPSMRWIVHTTEGPDDMPAHIKAALTAVSLSIPVAVLEEVDALPGAERKPPLRDRPHRREVVLHLSP